MFVLESIRGRWDWIVVSVVVGVWGGIQMLNRCSVLLSIGLKVKL